MVHLAKANLLELLRENGRVHVFAESWAASFFKRHGFSSRVATVMRLPSVSLIFPTELSTRKVHEKFVCQE